MNRRWLTTLVVAGGMLSAASLAFGQALAIQATSQYQSIPGSTPGMNFALNPAPLDPIAALSFASPDGVYNSFNAGTAWGVASVLPKGGLLYSYSRASGFNPQFGPPDPVEAQAYSVDVTLWQPSSNSLPAGTDIIIAAVLRFNGTLGAVNYFGQGSGLVTASAGATLTHNNNFTLFNGAAAVDAVDPGSGPPLLTTAGGWDGDFTAATIPTGGLGDSEGYQISTTETVFFLGKVGTKFLLSYEMLTTAHAEGPFEAWGEANFGMPNYYTLVALGRDGRPIDVKFDIVPLLIPEPSVIGLMVLGTGLCLLGRRRNR